MGGKHGTLRAEVGAIETDGDIAVLHVRFDLLGETHVDILAGLAPAEREVAGLVLAGKTSAQIAAQRRVAIRTVENQIASLYRKTGARSRAELVALLTHDD